MIFPLLEPPVAHIPYYIPLYGFAESYVIIYLGEIDRLTTGD